MSTLDIQMTAPTDEAEALALARAYFRRLGHEGSVTVRYYNANGDGVVNINAERS